jgi:sucrose-6-phosphate hydrolase SacC (GH32 family)
MKNYIYKKIKIITIITIIFLSIFVTKSCHSQVEFKDPITLWHLSDCNDHAGKNSQLNIRGEVHYVSLKGEDAVESKKRGGDGIVARFHGGWFDAGQGADNELKIRGRNFSMLVRLKVDSIKSFIPILSKDGDDQNIAYSLFFKEMDKDIYLCVKIGSDEIAGAHLLKYKIAPDELSNWLDVVFRFDGSFSELYVNGFLRDSEVTVGNIREWNIRPFLVGAQLKKPYGYSELLNEHIESKFKGLIDHVALWDRFITDEEITMFSGVKKLVDGRPKYYNEKYRPQFHFTAKKNWINDPNGLFFYDGIYHLFFQYMPPCRPGAYKDWGHAISTDLVHWEQIPFHITPHRVWGGCWSGSAVVDFANSAGFQKGLKKPIIAFITNGGVPEKGLGPSCTQCIAYSTDGGQTFTYYDQNPVINNIYNSNRDPKVVWDEISKKWIMSLYLDKDFDFGLFSSDDLKKWEYLSTFSLEGVTECPGFEPLPVDGNKANIRWLFFGANGNYMIGSFDGKNFIPETEVIKGDYGRNFYAGQTWNNVPDGRCILIAWMPTKKYPGMPFEQQMNFPTEITLRNTREGLRVFRSPIKEIENLYEEEMSWDNVILKKGDNLFDTLKGELFDMNIEINCENSSSFEIGIRGATIFYDVKEEMIKLTGSSVENNSSITNLGEASLSPINNKLKLRILVDRTSIEIFGNEGQVVITSCFMPQDEKTFSFISDDRTNISNMKIYRLKSIWD